MSNESQQNEIRREIEAAVNEREAATVDLDLLGELTPSQIKVIRRMRREALEEANTEHAAITEFDVEQWPGNRICVSIKVERTDCEPHSPRNLLCTVRGRFLVGPRGGIEVETHSAGDVPKRKLKKRPFIYGIRTGV